MDSESFAGKYPTPKVKDEHIIVLLLCALFKLVAKMIFNECFEDENERKKRKRERNRKRTTR